MGASASVVSWHLRHLAEFGLVEDAEDPEGDRRRRWWQSVGRGFRFEFPEDSPGEAAGRVLRGRLLARALAEVQRWATETEPELDQTWQRLAGVSNTGVRLTPEETRQLEADIEALIAPYVTRGDTDVPDTARGVRLVRVTMPQAPGSADEPRSD